MSPAVEQLADQRARIMARLATHPEQATEILAKATQAVEQVIKTSKTAECPWTKGVPPPRFDEFAELLDGQRFSPRQLQAFEKTGLLDPASVIDPNRSISELVLAWGKGSGKDWLSAKLIAWLAYVVCCLKGYPAQYFNSLAPKTRLGIVNVAPSKDLARDVFFEPYLTVFIKHPIFDEFRPKIGTEKITFARIDPTSSKPYEFLGLFSRHSQSRGLDGYNLLAWVMDEADAFMDKLGKSNADAVHNILRSSANTRMKRSWLGIVISYLRIEGGFLERLLDRARKDNEKLLDDSSFFADRAASWDVNPKISRDDPDIQSDYENDPMTARAMYECIPKAAESAFFEFPERISMAVNRSLEPCAYVETELIDEEISFGGSAHYVSAKVSNIRRTPGYTYFLGGDAGVGSKTGGHGDAYALAVFHVDDQTGAFQWLCPRCGLDPILLQGARYKRCDGHDVREVDRDHPIACGACFELAPAFAGSATQLKVTVAGWYEAYTSGTEGFRDGSGNIYKVGTIVEDLIIRIKPVRAQRPGEVNRIVSLVGVQQLCKDLMQGLGIRAARFDPWNTAQLGEELIRGNYGDVQEIKFGNPEQYRRARLVKALLYAGLIVLLPNDARDIEWRRLMLLNGTKINHPDGGSKDVYDAESVAIWTAATYADARIEMMFA